MRRGLILSIALHATVLAVAYFGIPILRREQPDVAPPVTVDVVTVDELTNAPVPRPPPSAEKALQPPPPPPPIKSEPSPPPEPVVQPEPEPEPKLAKLPEPEPTPEPEAQPETPPPPKIVPPLKSVQPKRKPEPPSTMASVLKTVESLKRDNPQEKPESKEDAPKEAFENRIARSLDRRTGPPADPDRPFTISEIDSVRRQIEQCWNVPAGARNAENLIVTIRVEMNADGTPRSAMVSEQARMQNDSFFRAAAESALRAVLNPRCHPFKLPPEKYDRWRTMTLVFNPKEMFGT